MPEPMAARLDAKCLQAMLDGDDGGQPIQLRYLESCDSTNIECLKAANHASLVVADHQRAGRGRRGNDWHSPAAGNIYLSLGVRRVLPAELLGLVSIQVGVSSAQALHQLGYPGVRLKWPNDLMLEGHKLGGILTETRTQSDNAFFLAIGLGLNCSANPAVFDAIDRPVASLGLERSADREALIAALARGILRDITALEVAGVDELIERFLELDGWAGQAVTVRNRERSLQGVYDGVERDGQLRVRLDDGRLQCFAAADISLRQGD